MKYIKLFAIASLFSMSLIASEVAPEVDQDIELVGDTDVLRSKGCCCQTLRVRGNGTIGGNLNIGGSLCLANGACITPATFSILSILGGLTTSQINIIAALGGLTPAQVDVLIALSGLTVTQFNNLVTLGSLTPDQIGALEALSNLTPAQITAIEAIVTAGAVVNGSGDGQTIRLVSGAAQSNFIGGVFGTATAVAGLGTGGFTVGGTILSLDVTFTTPFTQVPAVIVTPVVNDSILVGLTVPLIVTDVTATGFTVIGVFTGLLGGEGQIHFTATGV